jgi:hypothetical protein
MLLHVKLVSYARQTETMAGVCKSPTCLRYSEIPNKCTPCALRSLCTPQHGTDGQLMSRTPVALKAQTSKQCQGRVSHLQFTYLLWHPNTKPLGTLYPV